MNGAYTRTDRTITGIAGKTDFAAIYVEKSMMNSELGFARRLLKILERHNILLEHLPSGIDTMTVVIDPSGLCPEELNAVLREIKEELSPNNVEYVDGIALIAVVGHGMNRKKGTASRVRRCRCEYSHDRSRIERNEHNSGRGKRRLSKGHSRHLRAVQRIANSTATVTYMAAVSTERNRNHTAE